MEQNKYWNSNSAIISRNKDLQEPNINQGKMILNMSYPRCVLVKLLDGKKERRAK